MDGFKDNISLWKKVSQKVNLGRRPMFARRQTPARAPEHCYFKGQNFRRKTKKRDVVFYYFKKPYKVESEVYSQMENMMRVGISYATHTCSLIKLYSASLNYICAI